MTLPDPAPPYPTTAPRPSTGPGASSRWIPLLAGAVVIGCAGVGLGWLLWGGPDSAASGTGFKDAAADATSACQVFRRVPAVSKILDDPKLNFEVSYSRTNAAAALAHSAAQLDHHYDPLDKALTDITNLVQTNNLKGTEAAAAQKKLDTLCAQLDS